MQLLFRASSGNLAEFEILAGGAYDVAVSVGWRATPSDQDRKEADTWFCAVIAADLSHLRARYWIYAETGKKILPGND